MSEKQEPTGSGDGCFFVLWAYLMVLSIFLAPVVAHVIKRGVG